MNRKTRDTPRIWLVTWIDATGTNCWERREGAIKSENALLECQVVGRLLRVTRQDIMIAGGWSMENDNVTSIHTIPRSNVIRWQRCVIGRPTRKVRHET